MSNTYENSIKALDALLENIDCLAIITNGACCCGNPYLDDKINARLQLYLQSSDKKLSISFESNKLIHIHVNEEGEYPTDEQINKRLNKRNYD